nr:glycosyltransferase [uncultured Rhodopila sp.]
MRHRLIHLGRLDGVDLRVVAPVPWFPSAHRAFGRYALYAQVPPESEQLGLKVTHPRYPVLPKAGMTIAPLLMAAALLPRLLAMRRSGFDFDLIDSYYLYPDGVAAALLGLWLGRPVLMTAFGTDVSLVPNYAAPRRQILWAIRRSVAVTAVCQALKDKLVDLGASADKIEVILHGVDQALFTPPADRAALRLSLGFERPTLISIGHLIQRKGHDIVIQALAEMPGTDLVIVGDGPEEGALRRQAAGLKLTERVRFLGHVDQEHLPALLGAADALVLCSDREGIANVLMESLACGTPVVASPVWGSPEVVNVPQAGLLLRDRSAGSLVTALRQLLANPPDRALTRRYAERFSWSDTAARHARLVRLAVESASAMRSAATRA